MLLKSMEAPRAELRRDFDIRLQPMANIYVILVWYMADMDFKVRIKQE